MLCLVSSQLGGARATRLSGAYSWLEGWGGRREGVCVRKRSLPWGPRLVLRGASLVAPGQGRRERALASVVRAVGVL